MTPESRDAPLPATLAVFPLPGAILLPGGKLPLNIFEPRYLDMVRDAMSGERLIGMIQPRTTETDPPSLFDVGCVGRITSFTETEDGRYLITLTGLSRFKLVEEMATTTAYRMVVPDFSPYADDRQGEGGTAGVDRESLEVSLQRYLDRRGLGADWDAVRAAPLDVLVNSLAMICPFGIPEKQALLEAVSLSERAKTMVALMEFAIAEGEGAEDEDLSPPGLN